jgi:hypothetical protein
LEAFHDQVYFGRNLDGEDIHLAYMAACFVGSFHLVGSDVDGTSDAKTNFVLPNPSYVEEAFLFKIIDSAMEA